MAAIVRSFLCSSTRNIPMTFANKKNWGRVISHLSPKNDGYISFNLLSKVVDEEGKLRKTDEKYELPLDVARNFLLDLDQNYFIERKDRYPDHGHLIVSWEIIPKEGRSDHSRRIGVLEGPETPRKLAARIGLYMQGYKTSLPSKFWEK